MQIAKGSCVGKTFALAKLNDSTGGKKSKRRSKEERKGMVETFIKRYQVSNNGSFPSLHHTYKEVGGSYYTVREIFRELIQENRVLAPPQLPPGEQNMENLDCFLENYPLGLISFDPNIHVLPPKDNQPLLHEYEFRRENFLNSKKISKLHRGGLDNDNIVNGSSHTTVKNEEFEDPRYIEAEISQISGNDVVETSDAAVNMNPEEQIHNASLIGRGNKEEKNEGLELKHRELLMEGEKDEVKGYNGQINFLSEDLVVETFPLRPVSSIVYNVDEELESELELKTRNDNSTENIQFEYENMSPAEKEKPNFEDESDLKLNGSGVTSDRINLESQEASLKKSDIQESEANPIVSFIKTAVAAFMKFWSE